MPALPVPLDPGLRNGDVHADAPAPESALEIRS
jgi:hypothetical protein